MHADIEAFSSPALTRKPSVRSMSFRITKVTTAHQITVASIPDELGLVGQDDTARGTGGDSR
ncbi:MAG: hypothetical protein ACREXS_13095 [Gammaproteobacteria bacterium]